MIKDTTYGRRSVQQPFRIPNRAMSRVHEEFIAAHIQELLIDGAIEKTNTPPKCISLVAVVPKKWEAQNDTQPEAALQNVMAPKFRYENLSSLQETLQPGDWCTSIDLRNGYFHVPIHPSS